MKILLGLVFLLFVTSNGQSSYNVASCGQNIFGEGGTGLTTNAQQVVRKVYMFNSTKSPDPTKGGVAVKIDAGRFFSLVLADDGDLYSFGLNNLGQLGNGKYVNSLIPTLVLLNRTSSQTIQQFGAALGAEFAVALISDTSSGTERHYLKSWGSNGNGQLGTGSSQYFTRNFPVDVKMNNLQDEYIEKLSVGSYHTLILTRSNKLFTWGRNSRGELGDGTTVNKYEPTAVIMNQGLLGKAVVDAQTKGEHNIVLTKDGLVFAWGRNDFGQVGNGLISNNVPEPVQVTKLGSIVGICAGEYHNVAYNQHDTCYGWGTNSFGETGNKSTLSPAYQGAEESHAMNEMLVKQGEKIKRIECGNQNTFILTKSGKVWVYGLNGNGQLGLGTTDTQILGVKFRIDAGTGVKGAKSIAEISAGDSHTLIIVNSSSQTIVSLGLMILVLLSYLI